MNILFKFLILGFAILLIGCSKKVETTEPVNSAGDEKSRAASVETEAAKQHNIVNVPFDFKGVRIGMEVDEVKKIFPKLAMTKSGLACHEGANFTCQDKLTLINETPEMALFEFLDGKLDMVTILYDNKIFKDLFYGLKSKYGEPIELAESDSKDSLDKRIDDSMPLGVYWENINSERISITNFTSADVEGLTKGAYLFYSKERVAESKKNVESNKEREKFKRKDL